MRKLSLEIPDDAFSALRQDPEHFLAEMRLAAAAKWYEIGSISQEKAAAIAGLGRAKFIEALARYGVSPIQTTAEQLEEEFERG